MIAMVAGHPLGYLYALRILRNTLYGYPKVEEALYGDGAMKAALCDFFQSKMVVVPKMRQQSNGNEYRKKQEEMYAELFTTRVRETGMEGFTVRKVELEYSDAQQDDRTANKRANGTAVPAHLP